MQKLLVAALVRCRHARFDRDAVIRVTDGANDLGLFGQNLWWDSSTANSWLARACLPKPKAINATGFCNSCTKRGCGRPLASVANTVLLRAVLGLAKMVVSFYVKGHSFAFIDHINFGLMGDFSDGCRLDATVFNPAF